MRRFFRRGNRGVEITRKTDAAEMAGRIRSIKPEILDDEKTAALHDSAWRLFVSLWIVADDYGHFRAVSEWIAGQVFWVAQPGRPPVDVLMAILVQQGLVQLYTVRGQRYGAIVNWVRHQMVQKPGNPRVPGPSEADPEPFRNDSRMIPERGQTDSGLIPIPIPISDPDRDPDRDRESEEKHAEGRRAPDGPAPSAAVVEGPQAPGTVTHPVAREPQGNPTAPGPGHASGAVAKFMQDAAAIVARAKETAAQPQEKP